LVAKTFHPVTLEIKFALNINMLTCTVNHSYSCYLLTDLLAIDTFAIEFTLMHLELGALKPKNLRVFPRSFSSI